MNLFKILRAAISAALLICILLTTAQAVCKVGCTGCDPSCNCGQTNVCSSCTAIPERHLVPDQNYLQGSGTCVYNCEKGYHFNENHDCVPDSGSTSGSAVATTSPISINGASCKGLDPHSKWDDLRQICVCDDGYTITDVLDYCTPISSIAASEPSAETTASIPGSDASCKALDPHSKWDNPLQRCVCDNGYTDNAMGDCTPISSSAASGPAVGTTEPAVSMDAWCKQQQLGPHSTWDEQNHICICEKGYLQDQKGLCVNVSSSIPANNETSLEEKARAIGTIAEVASLTDKEAACREEDPHMTWDSVREDCECEEGYGKLLEWMGGGYRCVRLAN